MSIVDQIRNYGFYGYTRDGHGIVHKPPGVGGPFQEGEEWPIVVNAQTVADYIALDAPKSFEPRPFEDLAGLRLTPPFPHMVFHFERTFFQPEHDRNVRGETLLRVLHTSVEDADSEEREYIRKHWPDAVHILGFQLYTYTPGLFTTSLPVIASMYLDENGEYLDSGTHHLTTDPTVRDWRLWEINVLSEAYTAMNALAFLHVRHSELVEEKPTRAAVRRAERKNKPLLRHHKLVVKPLETHMRRVREHVAKTGGGKKALHMVRGHFATYTEEAPLLGHFVGTVWKAPHWRGHEDEGVVTKDYEVNIDA